MFALAAANLSEIQASAIHFFLQLQLIAIAIAIWLLAKCVYYA